VEPLKGCFAYSSKLDKNENQNKTHYQGYGNTGCGVFKRKLEMFLAKSQLLSNEITKFGELE